MTDLFWLVEESTAGRLRREGEESEPISLRLYRVEGGQVTERASTSYRSGTLRESTGRSSRAGIILDMLEDAGVELEPVVCSHRTASAQSMVRLLTEAGFYFVIEIGPDHELAFCTPARGPRSTTPREKLRRTKWQAVDPGAPNSEADYSAAELGEVDFAGIGGLHCLGLSTGGIRNYRRGLLLGLSNLNCASTPLAQRVGLLGWLRWVRPILRREVRGGGNFHNGNSPSHSKRNQLLLDLDIRHNLQVARELDERAAAVGRWDDLFGTPSLHGELAAGRNQLSVVELFAGAGGMGLGFLLANGEGGRRYGIRFSGELHPVYAQSLRNCHGFLRRSKMLPPGAVPMDTEAVDLTEAGVPELVRDQVGQVDVLIGGPPCQGMSNANRNSWSSENPHNRLIDTFIDYVELLNPRVLLLENVQGILWTPKEGGDLTVAGHVVERLGRLGYLIFPKILDAAWYGVPQHRNRFFLLGLRSDMGYEQDHFGRWGPFPAPTHGPGAERPYTTVKEAIEDLPPVPNGFRQDEHPYSAGAANEFLDFVRAGAPEGVIWDHVTSRHADYVIERYREIPEGGNWQDIEHLLTNYADVGRTHSNIYRRLQWGEPSITIGHYRKSMIVHPAQDRGLSLREAMRLQGFPDWVRFAGDADGGRGGLTHKQQQLANAVSPPVTRAVAEFLLEI